MTLKIYITIRHSASYDVVAVISPKPIVSIIVVPQ